MDRNEIDDVLYGVLTEALTNSGIPITARAKARIAGELTAEAVRMVLAQMKAQGTAPEPKARKTRGPNKPRTKPADDKTMPLPHIPSEPTDATTPAPFGARK